MRKTLIAALVATMCTSAYAGTDVFFNPLTQSAAVAQAPNHVNELNNPWQVPAGVSYKNLTSLNEVEADTTQSIIRISALGQNGAMFDMSAFDRKGRYVFIPHEVQYGAGLTRYDTATDRAVVLFQGDGLGATGTWGSDFGALDPATLTPTGTLLLGEEWSGQGRLFEVVNPMADVEAGETAIVNELHNVPNVSHEGLRFNHDGTALYFVDEDRSGSVYKFVPSVAGNYSKGQTFVLSVDGFAGDVTANAGKFPNNNPAERTGMATWVALTDVNGNALTTVDPFGNEKLADGRRAGRAAADEIGGTPYRRPEDVEVGYLRNGNEVLYFVATEEQGVYSVEELGNGKAMVRLAANENTAKNLGYAPTSGHITSPDNLAQDALGNIYVIEDWPNGDNRGGDIWFLRDTDGDGVAESMDHFMSLQVKGAENTGMIFNPAKPTQFIVSVQHPESTGVAGGMGDALWQIDLKGVVAPPCLHRDNDGYRHGHRRGIKACDNRDSSNFIKQLSKAGK